MAGKSGMTGPNLGGRREGAGRPREKFVIRQGDVFAVERQTIGGDFAAPELWTVLSVAADEIEFQTGNDIIVIRLPE